MPTFIPSFAINFPSKIFILYSSCVSLFRHVTAEPDLMFYLINPVSRHIFKPNAVDFIKFRTFAPVIVLIQMGEDVSHLLALGTHIAGCIFGNIYLDRHSLLDA